MILPQKIVLTKGIGQGSTSLNAFDSALLNAGVGNFNLVRVSSIVPPNSKIINLNTDSEDVLPAVGSIIPTVYSYLISNRPGEKISVVLGIALPKNEKKNGLIFEYSCRGSFGQAKRNCRQMIKEAAELRKMKIKKNFFVGNECIVGERYCCVIALALMLF